MSKELLARGQATITALTDAYTLTQSVGEYIFSAQSDGTITAAVSVVSQVSVTQDNQPVSSFTIGSVSKPAGFSAVTVDQANKRITFSVAAATRTLADQGTVDIPVLIAGVTYHLSFVWSKARAGAAGADASELDWVKEWNTGKTQIDQSTVITPKLFAGVKNVDGSLTGTAIGRYVVRTKNTSGALTSETVDGISGFKDGYKTFFLDNSGNVQLGRGDQFVKYNAVTGKVEFGTGVSLLWAGATYIDKDGIFTGTLSAATVSAVRLNASQITAGVLDASRINVESLKASILTAGNIESLTLNVTRGKIGGWSLDGDSIFRGVKNNAAGAFTASPGAVTLGANGLRGYKWALEATGAGALAGGNIRWDAAGKVTFDASVSVAWQAGIDTASELARAMSFGKMLYRDPTFQSGLNGIRIYNNTGNGMVTIQRVANSEAPNDSGEVLEIATTGEVSPGHGGFFFGNAVGPNKIFITRIIAKIPAGYKIAWASNNVGTGSTSRWLTSTEGTGKWEEFIFKVVCGNEGAFSSTNFFYLLSNLNAVLPIVWQVAYATVFDVTACEKYTTTLNAEGIYTGTIVAGQITTGLLSADRIAAGSIRAEKLDAASLQASIINTDYINALSCTFTKGTIGGWAIGSDHITSGVVGAAGATPIQIRSAASGAGYWYKGEYRPCGIIQTWYRTNNAGHIVLGQVAASGHSVKTGFVGLQMMSWDNFEYFCLSANTQLSGSKEVYNRIAGWAFDHQRIWKNSVSLGADGSIANGTKWMLNNDGSGCVAAGNIVWDAAGNVTFASSVSLNWTTPINTITTALGGSSYPKLTHISSQGIYTGTLTAAQVNAVGINAGSISTGTLAVERLDAAGIQSKIISTDYINALSCTFTKGTLGGWAIGSDHITSGVVGAAGATPIQIRSAASGSGYWYDGSYRPYGLSINWCRVGNAGHLVFGQVAASGSSVKTGFIGLQMMSCYHKEYFCLSANSALSGTEEVYNRIAGWAFDHERIWKNSVSLGADGTIQNGLKWKLHNDGSGCVASGNIAWDAMGRVNFAESVSVAWSAGIDGITAALGGATYSKLTKITATGIYTGTINAGQINVDSALVVGGSSYNGSISVRDASNRVMATLDRSGITAVGGRIGGWIINDETICAANPASGHRIFLTASGYLYNDNPNTGIDYWGLKTDGSATFGYGSIYFKKDGSGYLANENIKWDTAGNVELKGTITATGGKLAGFTIEGNRLINTASNSSIEFNYLMGNAYLRINDFSALLNLRADSARTGISIQTYATGAVGIFIIANTGSKYAIESYGPMQLGQRGGERWCVPGVLYIGSKYQEGYNSYYKKIWGDGVTVSSFTHLGSGKYKVVHNLYHTNYTVICQQWASAGYRGFYRLLERTTTYFVIQNVGTEGKADAAAFDFTILGQNTW